jgi:predicted ATPase/DNA-binding XRE family transcriptional regulator
VEDRPEKVNPKQKSSLGSRLRRLREAAGYTQEELAFRSGLTPNAISDLERGKTRHPYPNTVRALANALGLNEEDRAVLVATPESRVAVGNSQPNLKTDLPSPPTPLVGRQAELQEVRTFLGEVRLLTLTGTGGVGKTRLAMEAAREAAGHFPDGATFVALAPLSDPALVVAAVARSLGLRESEGQSPREVLQLYLRAKRLLLVLDNFEHLMAAALEVSQMIEACGELTVLVTSRAPLRIRGEQEYPVQPLKLPASTQDPSVEEVMVSPSVRLFVERAKAASPAFSLTRANVATVAAICWRLAGLPLALELAAAQVRFLDPRALLPRLDAALSAGWARDLSDRQRTMRATLDWSYDLLADPEKKLFRRLSVFAGGFSLEAVEAIGVAGNVAPEAAAGLLGRLVEQSLVSAERNGDAMRYGMLEPIRQYAREKLEEGGEATETLRRHALVFLHLAELAYPELRGPRQAEWLARLEQDNGNLRSVMGWALSAGEVEIAARLAWALYVFWRLRGHHEEGRRWTEVLMEQDLPTALRPRVVMVAAFMAYTQGDYEACERYSAKALDLAGQAQDTLCAAYAWCMLGMVAMRGRDFETAITRFEEALPLFRRSGEEVQVPVMHSLLGTALLIQGDHDRAVPRFEQALAMARRREDRIGVSSALYHLAQVALVREEHGLATRLLKEGVVVSEQMRDRANLSYFLEGLAVVAGVRGKTECSAHLFGVADGLLEAVGAPVYNYYKPDPSLYERAISLTRAHLGEEGFEEARERGRKVNFAQAVEYALEEDGAPLG